MGVSINIEKAVEEYKKKGGKTDFEDSLKQVLKFAKSDSKINSVSDLAYLLATAKAESDYSLQRWESDFVCGKEGVPYKDKPCQKALNYYRSSDGKKNYYELGVDRNGLPYFGRGLIQLTGKSNYQKYGGKIGVDLVNDGDKALEPKNSYNIAVEYMINKRGGQYSKNGQNRSTFDLANDGDLTLARKSVNGGTKGIQEVNNYYDIWKSIINNNLIKIVESSKNGKVFKALGYGIIVISIVGFAYGLYYFSRKK
jgi:predicted chitinase